ncbi:cyclase family protein [Rhodocaloribacter sp.]
MKPATFLLMTALALASCRAPEPPPAAFSDGEIIDLTYAFDENTVYWPTASGFEKTTDFEGITDAGYYYAAYSFCTAEHGGTHLDAPVHFAEGQRTTDEIPLTQLIGPAVVVDVTEQAAADRDYLVKTADFEAWEAEHGRLPDGVIVLLRTGFGRFWPDRTAYMGTDERGADAVPKLHFPGLDPEAARWLVEHRAIHAIGLDTPSIDYGQSRLFETHRTLFAANIPAFENVANLDRLPETGFTVIALPMKIRGGSGGPLRIVAVVPEG